ncbi:MAG: LysE family translocator [Pseudomonadota bacterium]
MDAGLAWGFLAACFFLLVSPGPGVLTTAGVGAGFGWTPGVRYVSGLCVGSNAVMLAVASGLAALVFAVPGLRQILLIASVGYLGYMALRIALSGSQIAFVAAKREPGFVDGVLLQTINPKAYVVGTTLFSGFAIWPERFVAEVAIKLVLLNLVWIPIHLLWLHAGVTLHRLALAPQTQRLINFAMASALVAVVGIALFTT